MALVKCRECQKEISSMTGSCPQCGAPTTSAIVGWVIIGVLIALFGAALLLGFMHGKSRERFGQFGRSQLMWVGVTSNNLCSTNPLVAAS